MKPKTESKDPMCMCGKPLSQHHKTYSFEMPHCPVGDGTYYYKHHFTKAKEARKI